MSPKGQLEPFTYEPGPLGKDEVEVAVTHCGICHSDMSMVDNEWGMSAYPLVPGHEVVGTVAAMGPEVRGLRIGQRVGVGWQNGSCGACEWCHNAKQHLCAKEVDTIVHHHGGFADRVRVQGVFAAPIPDGVDSVDAGPLMCAGITVYAPLLHNNVKPGMKTAVVGVGGLGHLAVQFLAKMGCDVTAISTTHDKDAEAKKLGATHFIATRGTDELDKAAGSFDFILVTATASLPWDKYLAALRPEGTICVVGVAGEGVTLPLFPMIVAEKKVVGGRASSPSDVQRMFAFAAQHGVEPMVERFAMKDINAAVERARKGARYRVVLEN